MKKREATASTMAQCRLAEVLAPTTPHFSSVDLPRVGRFISEPYPQWGSFYVFAIRMKIDVNSTHIFLIRSFCAKVTIQPTMISY